MIIVRSPDELKRLRAARRAWRFLYWGVINPHVKKTTIRQEQLIDSAYDWARAKGLTKS